MQRHARRLFYFKVRTEPSKILKEESSGESTCLISDLSDNYLSTLPAEILGQILIHLKLKDIENVQAVIGRKVVNNTGTRQSYKLTNYENYI